MDLSDAILFHTHIQIFFKFISVTKLYNDLLIDLEVLIYSFSNILIRHILQMFRWLKLKLCVDMVQFIKLIQEQVIIKNTKKNKNQYYHFQILIISQLQMTYKVIIILIMQIFTSVFICLIWNVLLSIYQKQFFLTNSIFYICTLYHFNFSKNKMQSYCFY